KLKAVSFLLPYPFLTSVSSNLNLSCWKLQEDGKTIVNRPSKGMDRCLESLISYDQLASAMSPEVSHLLLPSQSE
ncbi:hypothetical protein BaRGS_00032699, partial [Batillaria attramentaria]